MCPSARNLTPNKRTSRANNNDLSENTGFELEELAEIYMRRGVDRALARLVAQHLMAKDASAAHAHDELGISEVTTARLVQAALTFAVGAPCPCSWSSYRACPHRFRRVIGLSRSSGRDRSKGGWRERPQSPARVTFWGALAMALTAGMGHVFGTVV
jgi:VIT1/CCC1 family predicted Fe2+/Mn2+ transporter